MYIEQYSKISIILPVYNAEKQIHKCIKSVVEQDYPNYQLIIINDGSCDSTQLIIDHYKTIYSSIIAISKKNGGVSSARNTGLEEVLGDYLIFLDSDDRMIKCSLWKMNQIIKKNKDADVIIYGWRESNVLLSSAINRFEKYEGFISRDKCIEAIIKTEYGCGGGYPWNKIWKVQSIKKENKIHSFDEKLILCEDKEWTIRALANLKNIYICKEILYEHIISDKDHLSNISFDIVTNKNNERILSFLLSSISICKTLQQNNEIPKKIINLAVRTRNRDIIMVYYKGKKYNNVSLVGCIEYLYDLYIGKKIRYYGLKYEAMLLMIIFMGFINRNTD